jgi:thiol-disulfide isomerase/thioredoxin
MAVAIAAWALAAGASAQDQVVRAELSYRAPGNGPAPNFSPKGTQVRLADLPAGAPLPQGAFRPARTGTLEIGPNEKTWVGILASADPGHPKDLCRLFVDRNRNHDFGDDGPPLAAVPSVREKTGDSWSSFATLDLTVPYSQGVTEPYSVSVWIVRQGEEVPTIARYSVRSWRAGTVEIGGVHALVAAMDADNNAIFDKDDMWSVLEASAPDAAKKVLSIAEAKATSRMMFVKAGDKELVLEFRGLSPDGRSTSFAVVDRPVTKAEDRAADDTLAVERARPRAREPFPWEKTFDVASAKAAKEKRFLILDFWTSWCGPCKTMDEWIWTDAEVAAALNASYVGVKLDGDLEKALVSRFKVAGYPTFIVLDPVGKEVRRFSGYMSSKQTMEWLAGK